jgi:hypothetical protein
MPKISKMQTPMTKDGIRDVQRPETDEMKSIGQIGNLKGSVVQGD